MFKSMRAGFAAGLKGSGSGSDTTTKKVDAMKVFVRALRETLPAGDTFETMMDEEFIVALMSARRVVGIKNEVLALCKDYSAARNAGSAALMGYVNTMKVLASRPKK